MPEKALVEAPAADLPLVTPEAILWRWSVETFIVCAGRKKGERFLRMLADRAATEIEMGAVLPIRGPSSHASVMREKRKAAALLAAYMPLFSASLPPE